MPAFCTATSSLEPTDPNLSSTPLQTSPSSMPLHRSPSGTPCKPPEWSSSVSHYNPANKSCPLHLLRTSGISPHCQCFRIKPSVIKLNFFPVLRPASASLLTTIQMLRHLSSNVQDTNALGLPVAYHCFQNPVSAPQNWVHRVFMLLPLFLRGPFLEPPTSPGGPQHSDFWSRYSSHCLVKLETVKRMYKQSC